MADDEPSHDELTSQFCAFTGVESIDTARHFLTSSDWNLETAVALFYNAGSEDIDNEQEMEEAETLAEEPYTGPRTLDGRPAPQSIPSVASSSRAAPPPPRRGGINTLGSIPKPSGHGHSYDDDDDDDNDDDENGKPRDLFAGGEKSGLAVQDPNRGNKDPKKLANEILKKARANTKEGQSPASSSAPSRFRGGGHTLGGDDAPSQHIPDPHAQDTSEALLQTRTLHLWADGFSVENGPLHRFDDERNAADLAMIQQGRAPPHLMNIRPNEQVDVHLQEHQEDYKAPPKVYKPFGGSGQRLGSPTPGPSGSSATTMSILAAPTPSAQAASTPAEVTIDPAVPTLSLRIQLANGTRLPARFNTTQTIGDVYDFVNRASTHDIAGRSWVLATTFPNKDHTNKDMLLGEMAEFKRGGTAVQKWT
ncbi:hypothetical protein BJ878DRAFT_459760 [Calycina marina]|uniref:UBX domain-containing protein 1 n=1 Tax=Calycina marina TaxID=1763456 RepID=A0A9P7Z4E8_9HELO|nr:hypothetical protein BJ878DRAFT_459760 [Calycina marina]